jgi:DNA-binding protein HU-beta
VNKAQLVEQIRGHLGAGVSRAHAERALQAVMAGIEKGLKKDGAVALIGFGTFTVRRRGARMGRNPKTGEAIRIEPSRTVRFRAGRDLKGRI